jgi:hypothetical protein
VSSWVMSAAALMWHGMTPWVNLISAEQGCKCTLKWNNFDLNVFFCFLISCNKSLQNYTLPHSDGMLQTAETFSPKSLFTSLNI